MLQAQIHRAAALVVIDMHPVRDIGVILRFSLGLSPVERRPDVAIEFIQKSADTLQAQLQLRVLGNLLAYLRLKGFLHAAGCPLVCPLLVQRSIALLNELPL